MAKPDWKAFCESAADDINKRHQIFRRIEASDSVTVSEIAEAEQITVEECSRHIVALMIREPIAVELPGNTVVSLVKAESGRE